MWEQLQEESTSFELEESNHWSEVYTLPVVPFLQTVASGGLSALGAAALKEIQRQVHCAPRGLCLGSSDEAGAHRMESLTLRRNVQRLSISLLGLYRACGGRFS